MTSANLSFVAPALGAPVIEGMEPFAAAAWLWTHSEHHYRMPLNELMRLLYPAIQLHQYVLFLHPQQEGLRPVGYVAWANLSAEAERRYINNPVMGLQATDWCSGDRMWFTDWFTPFGHAREVARIVRDLLPRSCARSLYHRGNERGMRVLTYTGRSITHHQAQQWWDERPVLA